MNLKISKASSVLLFLHYAESLDIVLYGMVSRKK